MARSFNLARRVSTLIKRAGVMTHHPERNRDGVTVSAQEGRALVKASFAVRNPDMAELDEVIETALTSAGYRLRARHVEDECGHAALWWVTKAE